MRNRVIVALALVFVAAVGMAAIREVVLPGHTFIVDSSNRVLYGWGVKPTTPELPDGTPVGAGTPFWDTSTNVLYYWSGSAWTASTNGSLPFAGGTLTGPLVLPDGSASVRSLTWSSFGANGGFYSYGAGSILGLGWSGANYFNFLPGRFQVAAPATGEIQLYNDISLKRDNAQGTLALVNTDAPNDQMKWRTYGGYSSYLEDGALHEALTLSVVGTTTDTTANLLPAGAVIEAVVARVTSAITGAGVTSYSIGDATTPGRFATLCTLSAGDTCSGIIHVDQTGAAGPKQSAAAKVRVTAVGATPTGGLVRLIVYYKLATLPAS